MDTQAEAKDAKTFGIITVGTIVVTLVFGLVTCGWLLFSKSKKDEKKPEAVPAPETAKQAA